MDIESFWEYEQPAASETRFRAALPAASGDTRLELLTQIARTHSLRKQFAEAHALLDAVEAQLADAGPAPRVRYRLERGRSFNSAGDKARARPLFEEAFALAQAAGLEGLAVDAAHMAAIVEGGAYGAHWTQQGLAIARGSADPKARALLPALLNNHAWNLFDAGEAAAALPVFREAEAAWAATGRQPQGRIASWSVARCLRELGRIDEALALQTALAAQWQAAGAADSYVFEELGELHERLAQPAESRRWLARAAAQAKREEGEASERAQKLAQRAGGAAESR